MPTKAQIQKELDELKQQGKTVLALPLWTKIVIGVLVVGLIVMFIILFTTKKKTYDDTKLKELLIEQQRIQKSLDSIKQVEFIDSIRADEREKYYSDQKKTNDADETKNNQVREKVKKELHDKIRSNNDATTEQLLRELQSEYDY